MLKSVSAISGFVSPTFSGNVTLSDGNLVIGTADKGINFSAAGGDILKQYDEGTFSFTERAKGNITGSVTASNFNYVKVGKNVYCSGQIAATITTLATLTFIVFDLPFNSNLAADTFTGTARYNDAYLGTVIDPSGGSATTCGIYFAPNQVLENGAQAITFSLTYIAAT